MMTQSANSQAVLNLLARGGNERFYTVLDGASIPELRDRLWEWRPEHACLFRGKLAPDMAEVAPYMVTLEAGTPFTDWLLAGFPGQHWGVFASARAPFPVVRTHFRAMVNVFGPDGRPLLFRYYDPRVLRLFLPTCTPEELAEFFGPMTCFVVEDEDGGLLRFWMDESALRKENVQSA